VVGRSTSSHITVKKGAVEKKTASRSEEGEARFSPSGFRKKGSSSAARSFNRGQMIGQRWGKTGEEEEKTPSRNGSKESLPS